MNREPSRAAQTTEGASLLFGKVRHQRLKPAANSFSYGVYMLRLPLRRLSASSVSNHRAGPEDVGIRARGFSINRPNLLSYFDADHGTGQGPASQWVDQMLATRGITDANGEMWLHTFPRVLGYVFNPVSFYFCERSDGTLRAIVCEVNNTFGERYAYVLQREGILGQGAPLNAEKAFHVSPFCRVEGNYTFRFMNTSNSPLRSIARIDYEVGGDDLLLTSVSGVAQPLDSRAVRHALLAYPLMTIGVMVRIHWQAMKLWRKRVPFRSKPAPPAAAIAHDTDRTHSISR
jgi:DUF1365 family protein